MTTPNWDELLAGSDIYPVPETPSPTTSGSPMRDFVYPQPQQPQRAAPDTFEALMQWMAQSSPRARPEYQSPADMLMASSTPAELPSQAARVAPEDVIAMQEAVSRAFKRVGNEPAEFGDKKKGFSKGTAESAVRANDQYATALGGFPQGFFERVGFSPEEASLLSSRSTPKSKTSRQVTDNGDERVVQETTTQQEPDSNWFNQLLEVTAKNKPKDPREVIQSLLSIPLQNEYDEPGQRAAMKYISKLTLGELTPQEAMRQFQAEFETNRRR